MDAVRGPMALLSRSFIRRRAIGAVTASVVSMASLALQPSTIPHGLPGAATRHGPAWHQAPAEASSPRWSPAGRMTAQFCNWRLHALKDSVRPEPLPPLG